MIPRRHLIEIKDRTRAMPHLIGLPASASSTET